MVEEIVEEEELLNLNLSIVTDSGVRDRKRKRKIRALFDPFISNNYHGCDEAKIFRLLQMREQMLKPDKKRKGIVEDHGKGLHLIHLLLITATAIDDNNVSTALQNLSELYQTVALTGDSVQRVVAYFADGLSAKLLTRKSPFHDMLIQLPTNEEEFLAFTYLYRVSPYYQFAHFTANQAILEAFEREEDSNINNRALHVVDFDVSYGFQWPSLIQSLSDKASSGHKILLRITGFGTCLEQLKETETRLVSFAKGFTNLVFEFQGSLRSSSSASSMVMMKKKNETVAVNLVFHLNTLNDHFFKVSDTLKSIHSISPAIVVLVEQEGSRNPRSFLSRFMESLHYFAAMFDSLDDCLPLESAERLSIEKNHLGKEIKSMLNYEIRDNNNTNNINNNDYEDNKNNETWKGMKMDRHGFKGMKMSSKCLIQAKLLLKIRSSHQSPIQFDGENSSSNISGFRVFEKDEGKAICLGWQDRSLLTATAWHCI